MADKHLKRDSEVAGQRKYAVMNSQGEIKKRAMPERGAICLVPEFFGGWGKEENKVRSP